MFTLRTIFKFVDGNFLNNVHAMSNNPETGLIMLRLKNSKFSIDKNTNTVTVNIFNKATNKFMPSVVYKLADTVDENAEFLSVLNMNAELYQMGF